MAEARPEIDEGIVKCPICFEVFTKPKSLPCLHTFCLECLSTYITKCVGSEGARSTGFSCPICRAVTVPLNAMKNPELWAEQFPTNSVIMHVLEITKFREKEQFCDPCQKRSKGDIKAENWCKNCKAYLCSDCVEFHNSLLQDHCLVSVDAAISNSAICIENHVTICAEHEEKLDMFCCDHQHLACAKCIAIDHRRCDKVVTTKVFARELQTTGEINKIDTEMENRLLEISKVEHTCEQQLKKLEDKKETIANDVVKFTDEMVKVLRKYQENCISDLTHMYKSDVDNVREKVRECKSIKQTIEYSRKLLRAAEICGESDEIVSTTLKTTSDYEVLKKKASELEVGADDEVSYELDNELMNEYKQRTDLLNKLKIRRSYNMAECKANNVHSFTARLSSDKSACRLTGVLCVKKKRVLLCDEANGKLKLFEKTGAFLSELTISKPWDLCFMENSKKVLVSSLTNRLAIIDIDSDSIKLSSVITSEGSSEFAGIGFADGNIFVSLPRENPCSLRILDSSGRKLRTVNECERKNLPSDIWHLTVNSKSKEIIISSRTQTRCDAELFFFDYNGQSRRRLMHPEKTGGRGIDVDVHGNIYICGTDSSNIIQLSPDGSSSRVLLSAADGLDKPAAISFDGKMFAVTEDGSSHADLVKIYEMIP